MNEMAYGGRGGEKPMPSEKFMVEGEVNLFGANNDNTPTITSNATKRGNIVYRWFVDDQRYGDIEDDDEESEEMETSFESYEPSQKSGCVDEKIQESKN